MAIIDSDQSKEDAPMTAEIAKKVREDFESWSGGLPPDSEMEIFVYVEYARNANTDPIEVTHFLQDWMAATTDLGMDDYPSLRTMK